MDEAGARGAGRHAQARKVSGRLMHQANRALVLNLIRRHPSLSRARIARETGLSPATVGTIVDHLLAENLVHEETKVATGAVGRRPVGLRFNPQARQALGIDIDVLEITAALVDLGGGMGPARRLPVPPGAGPALVLDLTADLVRQVLAQAPGALVLGAGVALPGMVSWPEGVSLFSPNFGWRDVPFKALLQERLGLGVLVENEVRAAALAEFRYGAARGTRTAAFIDVGYGVGGAVIVDGSLYRGVHGAAAEIGHNTIEPGGPLCACGKQGCLEVFASASGMVARALEALDAGRASSLHSVPRAALDFDQLALAAAAGDCLAVELAERAAAYLGLAVANMIDNWDPEMVVLSGSVIRAGGRLLEEIEAFEQRFVLRSGAANGSVAVTRSLLGAEAKIVGAAGLVIAEFLAAPLAPA
jgi:predicted NBD/HSP70 family sugar kinase